MHVTVMPQEGSNPGESDKNDSGTLSILSQSKLPLRGNSDIIEAMLFLFTRWEMCLPSGGKKGAIFI